MAQLNKALIHFYSRATFEISLGAIFANYFFMKSVRHFGRQWRAQSSVIYLYGKKIQFAVTINSTLPKKTRRAILLNLFRAFKSHVRDIHLDVVLHSDGALKSQVSAMMRGTMGKDSQTTDTDRKVLGIYLRLLRTKQELTQAQLAKKLGVHRAYWSRVEHGTRSMSSDLHKKVFSWLREKPPAHESFLQIEASDQSIFH